MKIGFDVLNAIEFLQWVLWLVRMQVLQKLMMKIAASINTDAHVFKSAQHPKFMSYIVAGQVWWERKNSDCKRNKTVTCYFECKEVIWLSLFTLFLSGSIAKKNNPNTFSTAKSANVCNRVNRIFSQNSFQWVVFFLSSSCWYGYCYTVRMKMSQFTRFQL